MKSARLIREVFILGRGCSVNELTKADVEHINHTACVIALSKFMTYYKLVNVLPTPVFFIGTHPGGTAILQHIFDVCIENKIRDLTFVLHRNWRWHLASSQIGYQTRKLAIRVIRRNPDTLMFLVPSSGHIELVTRPRSTEGGRRASSLEEPLFHYRGSLTSALNYVSKVYPNVPINLVGVELNSPRYFFQAGLKQLELEWQDCTTAIVTRERRHFGTIDWKGTTIFDQLDVILSEPAKTNKPVVNWNPSSMLVTRGFTPHLPVAAEISGTT